jgi:catalase
VSPVNDNFRDGFHQQAVHAGRTPYLPNAVGGGCPFLAGVEDGGYVHVPLPVDGVKTRERTPDDEYTQARMFWRSVSEVERDHIVDAYTFELGKVDVPAVVERMVLRLTQVDVELAARVAMGLGLPVPSAPEPDGEADASEPMTSPSLAMVTENEYPVDGRVVHVLANDGCDLTGIRAIQKAILAAGAVPHVIAPHKGAIAGRRRGDELTVDRSFHTASSAECDAIVVAHGTGLAGQMAVATYVQAAYRHMKPIAAWGDGVEVLESAGIAASAPGVFGDEKVNRTLTRSLLDALGRHRHWDRADPHPTLVAVNTAADTSTTATNTNREV